jgi:hypothetical protein
MPGGTHRLAPGLTPTSDYVSVERQSVTLTNCLSLQRQPEESNPCAFTPPVFKTGAAPPRLQLPIARITRRARGHAGRNASHSTGAEPRSIRARGPGNHLGRIGARSGNMPAWSVSSPPFLQLQAWQAATMLAHSVLPP